MAPLKIRKGDGWWWVIDYYRPNAMSRFFSWREAIAYCRYRLQAGWLE